jgi:PPK2 family polyphosphate:nucleotide phosphotransferase
MSLIKPRVDNQFKNLLVNGSKKVKLSNYPADYIGTEIKKAGKKQAHNLASEVLEESRAALIAAQEKLSAEKKYGVLIVLQGMDTAGKDGAIRHILSGLNPQGCRVQGFKAPTIEEHAHSFLWRYQKVAPARGEVVVFNRSHYEDVLAVKVHPQYLESLPANLGIVGQQKFWNGRYEDINSFEKHLARNGIVILKFFLHISKEEQKNRLLERLTTEEKYWKISPSDLVERGFWGHYTTAYEALLSKTSQTYAPWVVVPANDKKIARAIIAHIIADAINNLNIDFPQLDAAAIAELRKLKFNLEHEDS